MNVSLETRIKDISLFLGFFFAMFITFSTLRDVSRLISLSMTDNMLVAGAAILGIIAGLIVFNLLPRFFGKRTWQISLMLVYILGGLGGIAYTITPLACLLVAFAAFGLFTFINPMRINEWSQVFFGPGKTKNLTVSVAIASSCVYYSIVQLTSAAILNAAIFAACLLGLGVWWLIWIFFGKQVHMTLTEHEPAKSIFPEHIAISKYFTNLIIIIGWNFLFLMLVEYWYTYNTSQPTYWYSSTSQYMYLGFLSLAFPGILGYLIAAACVGAVLMLFAEIKFMDKQARRQALYLECLIAFYVFTELYFFNPANPVNPINTPNFVYMVASMVVLPVVIGGIFQSSPFEYRNKLFDLLQNMLIVLALGFIVISGTIIPGLFTPFGSVRNTIFPTIYLFNIILLGLMFVFNILRLSIVDESILPETTIGLKDDGKQEKINNS